MTIREYRSDQAGAPVLTGETGSLNALIHACAVTGYGVFPALGWTRDFHDAASSTSAYKCAGTNPFFLQIADAGPGAGSFREARARLYGDMTGFNTGTEPVPTVAQLTNGYFIRKSLTLDAVARPWLLIGDERRLYFFPEPGDVNSVSEPFVCGDVLSYKAGDAYKSAISGRITENSGAVGSTIDMLALIQGAMTGGTTMYIRRSYTQSGASVAMGKIADTAKTGQTANYGIGAIGMPYPGLLDNALWMSKIYVHEGTTLRGELPGIWCPLHPKPLIHGDTFTGVSGLAGRNFRAINLGNASQLFMETTNTWDI